jgi:hypothetical protein
MHSLDDKNFHEADRFQALAGKRGAAATMTGVHSSHQPHHCDYRPMFRDSSSPLSNRRDKQQHGKPSQYLNQKKIKIQ